ncbi:hypothetical protein SE15_12730 [Thermanaerothrix daxensis]|uniref:SCP domain-containing protein n=1 Tax=Thermanaerothrix daxensis TaxID=869279 RepID=A0A0P6Y9V0_9CHLR|nr:hypothetical protein SE15_12730 [Thermanaerothrix daxensis]
MWIHSPVHRLLRGKKHLLLTGYLLIGLGLGWLGRPAPAHGQTSTHTLYLPLVMRSESTACQPLTPQEQAVLDKMRSDPNQGRQAFNCDPILQRVARERAQDMGLRNYCSHINPDGYGPNYLVRQAGYPLPTWYGQEAGANNIESIACYASSTLSDWQSVSVTIWQNWMASEEHRVHLLGLNNFYAEQTDYGIGYANLPGEGWAYRSYWVVITARRGP